MKKLAIALMGMLILLASCQNSKPPVVLDSQIHISVMVPEDTAADDAIFISGPFTGGDNFSVGNPKWKLTRSGLNCSILLNPEDFIGGKSLADGFWFYSASRGAELDADGNAVRRTLKGDKGEYVVARWTK